MPQRIPEIVGHISFDIPLATTYCPSIRRPPSAIHQDPPGEKMKRLLAFAALTVLACAAATTLLAQNPLVGTWKLNVAKSKYNSGVVPKSLTRTVEAQGDKMKYTFDGVTADGKAINYNFTVSYDGKDYPITGSGAPGGADTIAIKQLNPSSYDSTLKKAGQPVLTTKAEISKDGKTTTLTQAGVSGSGPTNTLLFEKQ
jgi:hypothetical protein